MRLCNTNLEESRHGARLTNRAPQLSGRDSDPKKETCQRENKDQRSTSNREQGDLGKRVDISRFFWMESELDEQKGSKRQGTFYFMKWPS